MSRSFDDSIPDKIENASVGILSDEPITLACWFKPSSLDSTDSLISIGDSAGPGFWRLGTTSADQLFCQKQDNLGSGSGVATLLSPLLTVGTWFHCCAVFESNNSRTVYLDGSNLLLDTTNVTDPNSNRTSIGIQAGNLGTPAPADGLIAEVGIWNVSLTPAEIISLAKGFVPRLIRRNSLVLYAPLIRDIINLKGLALTATGTTVADHPRVFQ